jgi:flagellar protein FlbD
MIVVTRLHGSSMALNCDLIERVEATPETVLTLVDGNRYVIRESVGEIVDRVRAFRASWSCWPAAWTARRPASGPCTWSPTRSRMPDAGYAGSRCR